MKMEFRVLNTDLKGKECMVDQKKIRVGRAEENDIVLPQRSVSRHHATIRVGDEGITVEDAGSRNETQLDGKMIDGPAPISDGAILSFGDVAVQVLFEQQTADSEKSKSLTSKEELEGEIDEPEKEGVAAGSSEAAAASMGSSSATGGGLAQRTQAGDVQATGEGFESKLWPTLVVVLGLMVGAVLVIFFFRSSGVMDMPVEEIGLAVRLGDMKVIQVPSGFTRAAAIRPPGAVEVSRPLNLDIAIGVEAKSQGLATVRLENAAGQYVLLHVNVLSRSEERVEEFFSESIDTRGERTEAARQRMRRAGTLRRDGEIYKAMQEYERAVELLEPLAGNPPPELRQADAWRRKLQEKVQKEYDQLTFEMSTFMRGGDKEMALQRLADIKKLIPDEGDVRRQNADLMYRLLQRVIRRENERRR